MRQIVMTPALESLLDRWDSGEGKPYKGSLVDWAAYVKNPADPGCMCAQGQVLHFIAGFSQERLAETDQITADKAMMEAVGISRAHAILLRNVNDGMDGAPSCVLTDPAKVIGDQAEIILKFWHHLDVISAEDWDKVSAARVAARVAAWDAARDAAGDAARDAAGAAAWDAAGDAARAATYEIQGATVMRKNGQPFTFLPMFGFSCPEEIGVK